jgi:hypothetical protein
MFKRFISKTRLINLITWQGRILDSSTKKEPECGFRNCLSTILREFKITLRAYYDAIISVFTPNIYRYQWNCVPTYSFLGDSNNRFPAISAVNTHASTVMLSSVDPHNDSRVKLKSRHYCKPPKYNWRKGLINEVGRLYQGEDWTGIWITYLHRLFIGKLNDPNSLRPLKLKHPIYPAHFAINRNPNTIIQLPESQSLSEAKKLAEWYYKEWLKVNNNEQ